MALFPPIYLDCVVAIGTSDQRGQTSWFASGFLMGRFIKKVSDTISLCRVFLVTNRHVLKDKKRVTLRFNPKTNAPATELNLELFDPSGRPLCYFPSKPEADVGVITIDANTLDQLGMQFDYFVDKYQVANKSKLSQLGITEGDFVYVLGFPLGLVGIARSYVIARVGVIARIRDLIAGHADEFLIDTPVFPGNSGGPVISKPEVLGVRGTTPVNDSLLIGVVESYVTYEDTAWSLQTQSPRITFIENSGLTNVVPIDFVEEAIELQFKDYPAPEAH